MSTCPVEAVPVPITDTAYDDHHRASRVTRYLAAADGGNRVTDTTYYADDSVKSVRRAVGTGQEQAYASYTYNPNDTLALITVVLAGMLSAAPGINTALSQASKVSGVSPKAVGAVENVYSGAATGLANTTFASGIGSIKSSASGFR